MARRVSPQLAKRLAVFRAARDWLDAPEQHLAPGMRLMLSVHFDSRDGVHVGLGGFTLPCVVGEMGVLEEDIEAMRERGEIE